MKKRMIAFVTAMVLAGTCLTITGGLAIQADETYNLRMTMTATSMSFASDIADEINAATDGKVNVEIIDVATLGGAADGLSMFRDGGLDMVMLPAAQTPGEFPVTDIAQLPFFMPTGEASDTVLRGLFDAGLMHEYDDMELMFFASTDPQMLGFKNDTVVSSVDDFKGLKVRGVSGITTEFIEKVFGATCVTMGMNDVYMSLQTGVIDAAISSPNQMVQNSFSDVMKSVMNQPLYYGALYCAFNADKWASLPEDIQNGIKAACEQKAKEIREYYDSEVEKNIGVLKDAGVDVYEPAPELVDILESTTIEQVYGIFKEKLSAAGLDADAVMTKAEELVASFKEE